MKCPTHTEKMKQLDVVASPPAFVGHPNLTLTHVTFDLDPCDLYNAGQSHTTEPCTVEVVCNVALTNPDGQTESDA